MDLLEKYRFLISIITKFQNLIFLLLYHLIITYLYVLSKILF